MAAAMPRAVVVLGLVSLCMDTSSELIHSLLPVFVVAGLGASPLLLGLIEGIAEATASITRIFSGVWSDRMGRRKPLLLAGYGLAALSKPLFPLADSALTVLAARFADRVGKGIRGAPRDALLADVTPPELRGAAYGLRQALDTTGAILGPLAALLLMGVFAGDLRAVLWVAVLPAVLAVLLILLCVPEPARPVVRGDAPLAHWREIRELPRAVWWVAGFAALLSLARFSEAFLLLRAHELGLAAARVPLVLIAMNIAYALSSWPAGRLSDRHGRGALLLPGLALLAASHGVLALASDVWAAGAGALLWGLHMGLTQGVLSALVADAAPERLRGTAFGVMHFAMGVALLAASVLAGWAWTRYGAALSFGLGAGFAVMAALLASSGAVARALR